MSKTFVDFLPNAFMAGIGAFLDSSIDDFFVSVFGAESRWKWNARTSGIVLVASVGSYCAYRICSKYFGNGFVWTLLDSTRLDQIPRADSRLLHPAAEGFFYPRRSGDSEDEPHKKLASLKPIQAESGRKYKISATRSGSPIRILCDGEGLRKRPSKKGLEGISQDASVKKSITTRIAGLGDDLDNIDAKSDLTSISRVVPASIVSNAIYDVDGDLLDDLPDEYPSSQCSVKYTESEAGWEEDSFTHGFSAMNPCFSGSPTPSDISNLSCVKNLKRLLQEKGDVSTSASVVLEKLNTSNMSTISDMEDNCSGLHNIAEMIQSKCSAQNVQYMYESVHLGDASTSFDTMSVMSFQSTSSFRRMAKPKGLYDLTTRPSLSPTPSTFSRRSSIKVRSPLAVSSQNVEKSFQVKPTIVTITDEGDVKNVMTDSCFSRSSFSSNPGVFRRSTMFDSGLSTDFTSEDDRSSIGGCSRANGMSYEGATGNKMTWLDKILEQNTPQSSPKHTPRSVTGSVASINISAPDFEWEDDPTLTVDGTEV